MTKDDFQKYLGGEFIVTDICEDDESQYAFYQSKKFVESNGNDRFVTVGNGPLYFNKATGELKHLGITEFIDHHSMKSLFIEKEESTEFNAEILKAQIHSRGGHINIDEVFELMIRNGMEPSEFTISTNENEDLEIESSKHSNMHTLKLLLQEVNVAFSECSELKIILPGWGGK